MSPIGGKLLLFQAAPPSLGACPTLVHPFFILVSSGCLNVKENGCTWVAPLIYSSAEKKHVEQPKVCTVHM